MPCMFFLASLLLSGSAADVPAERLVPFWPDAVPQAIRREVDGVATLETVRALSRFHRVHGSPGFAAAAEHVRKAAEAAGLRDATIERFPADGAVRYAHFRSYLGWTAEEGVLEEVAPRTRTIARFPDLPVALADYSQDADVTAALVDVGAGRTAADYEGKDVKGKVVLASGPLPLVHRLAVEERGALGFVSDFPNQTTAWSGDDRDLVRWGHLSPYQTKNTFAFMVSKRQSAEMRSRVAAGEVIQVRARVKARMVPATYDVVSAVLPGTDPSAGEVLLTAHLCHQSAGANDNASGSAAILEVGRALQAAVAAGRLPRPRLSIRFLWAPEIAGSQAWAVRHSDLVRRTVAGIHMDMVGGLPGTIRGTFHLSRSAASRPHVVNEIARAWFDHVVAASAAHAERGGDAEAGLVWRPGSREAFAGDLRGIELGSDHQVFQDSSHGVPMVYFHDWPDVTIHTHRDQPENLDATKLGRVAYMGAGIAWTLAALPAGEAPRLRAYARASLEELSARAGLRAALVTDAWDAAVVRREASAVHVETMRSLGTLWPGDPEPSASPSRGAPAPAGRDARVPVRSPEVKGPLDVYYYDHIEATLGALPEEPALAREKNGDVLAYEALNLVDGRRTVAEIRDVLTGRYAPVPVAAVSGWLDLLARAGVLTWRK